MTQLGFSQVNHRDKVPSKAGFSAQISNNLSIPARRISRDEMNLAEFPLTVLSTRAQTKLKTLEFCDSIRGRNGEILDRKWIITGADKFGLPTSSDDEVLLGLLKLTVDNEFGDRKVFFTRYELLRILRWTTEGRSYTRLQRALDRLSGVRIKATNAFYDNDTKSHSTRNFGIIDSYEINDGRNTQPKPSFFTWSEALFKSFQVGFIKKLDLDFYLGLKSAVSKRLYRYLDKHFWYKSKVVVNLFMLAHEKIGISRNYSFASSIRQQLDPALNELIESGFLGRYEYLGRGRGSEIVLYSAAGIPRVRAGEEAPARLSDNAKSGGAGDFPRTDTLVSLLGERGIGEEQAKKLLANRTDSDLKKIQAIIEYFDKLISTDSRLISRSPVGFLYRAVQTFETFVLPIGRNSQQALNLKSTVSSSSVHEARLQENKQADRSLETEYLVERKREIQRLRQEVEPEMLTRISKEVETALVKLRKVISETRFLETVEHGVEEKLAKLFAVPDFEEWCRKRKVKAQA